jgi:hypothetical protein
MGKCKNCERIITTQYILCCTCGSFCCIECMDEYHKHKIPYGFNYPELEEKRDA